MPRMHEDGLGRLLRNLLQAAHVAPNLDGVHLWLCTRAAFDFAQQQKTVAR